MLIIVLFVTTCLAASNQDSNKFDPTGSQVVPLDFLPALKGDYFRLDSEIIGRSYHIYIRYPEGYDQNQERHYPVVYLLDGDSLFPILAANHLFLTYDDKLPEAIIVGIAYGGFDAATNRRSYDFSTPAENNQIKQGGAEDFLAFLETELLPHVEEKYRADPQRRILFGQSRGGYMVLYTAMQKPDLFWGRIASNPTLNPGREQFFATPAEASRHDLTLVVTSSAHDIPALRASALEWQDYWANRESTPWKIAFNTTPNGTHAANSTDSYRFGLHQIFAEELQEAEEHKEADGTAYTN
ncbi:alpha/beta hydrolase-fold protein [Microbulbifer bruguierae]|uniref:Alpha/beta hydrolase-fold protein n=1 Tax=Microbulbifer bruguierae TaxID=3029061 RepID=A0ABY8NIE9_9GAMM|nr:alpha/beta hydrolase-fold protein [Microbulbifer bruguierae]WGL17872.1 alpha/beta hydrolase-fold protein [Microbulbifer bruguierae]